MLAKRISAQVLTTAVLDFETKRNKITLAMTSCLFYSLLLIQQHMESEEFVAAK